MIYFQIVLRIFHFVLISNEECLFYNLLFHGLFMNKCCEEPWGKQISFIRLKLQKVSDLFIYARNLNFELIFAENR